MTTTVTRPPTFFFSTTNPNNPHAVARAKARRAIYVKRPGFSSYLS